MQASAEKVHHILIYGCTTPAREDVDHWSVGDMGGVCHWNSEVNTILWAWALDAPKFDLPDKVELFSKILGEISSCFKLI